MDDDIQAVSQLAGPKDYPPPYPTTTLPPYLLTSLPTYLLSYLPAFLPIYQHKKPLNKSFA